MGRHQEALEAYDEAIEIKPRDADAWYHKGEVLYVLERWTDAREAVHSALELGASEAREARDDLRRAGH